MTVTVTVTVMGMPVTAAAAAPTGPVTGTEEYYHHDMPSGARPECQSRCPKYFGRSDSDNDAAGPGFRTTVT